MYRLALDTCSQMVTSMFVGDHEVRDIIRENVRLALAEVGAGWIERGQEADTIEGLLFGPRRPITVDEYNAAAVRSPYRLTYEIWDVSGPRPVTVAQVTVWCERSAYSYTSGGVVMEVGCPESGSADHFEMACDHRWIGRDGSILGPNRGITDWTCEICGARRTDDSSD